MLYGMGMIDSGIAMCYEELIFDNEIVHMVRRILKGMAVNADTLAVEVTKAVGPVGNFLGQKHTRMHMRDELSRSALFERRMNDAWVRAGATDVRERAREKALALFENQKTDPVAPEIAAKLRSIVEAAEAGTDEEI